MKPDINYLNKERFLLTGKFYLHNGAFIKSKDEEASII